MFQKRKDLEIVAVLQKSPKHLRQIAKELAYSPASTMRMLNTLTKENVADYVGIGRSKQYYLKDSLEKTVYIHMMEQYRKLQILQKPLLRSVIEKILQITTQGELVILFGSYAKNLEGKNSDIDIYVETKSRVLKKEIGLVSEKLSIKIGNFDKTSGLGKEIIKNHIILQNSERYLILVK